MYQALYRKYRPRNFEDLVGQSHITKVLENQIETNTISHAYLFSGTRGTGKTSAAKIFARAVNCTSKDDIKPCNECDNCLESLDDSTIDIIEIDAASNNGVDNIRDLKDRAFYQPASLKYKVYIIDEVHMLSKGAFNALLKILEEPPEHLIFILATTEPERIPLTILSRCQKFQFNRIDPQIIEDRLAYLSQLENKIVEKRVLKLIVSRADGSMRDALSILDQLLTSGDEEITYDKAISILGVVNSDLLFELVKDMIDSYSGNWMDRLDSILSSGKDIDQLTKDILEHFRRLMLAKVTPNSLDRYIFTDRDKYLNQSETIDLNDILAAMKILINNINESRYSQQKRALLEMAIIEIIALISNDTDINEKPIIKDRQDFDNRSLEKLSPDKADEIDQRNIKKDSAKESFSVDSKITRNPKIDYEKSQSAAASRSDDILSLERIKSDWRQILAEIRKSDRKSIHAFIMESSLESYDDGTLTVGFPKEFDFHLGQLMKNENRETVEKILSMFYNVSIKLNAIFIDNTDDSLEEDISTLKNLVGKENIVIL